jgi:hypothetical protein
MLPRLPAKVGLAAIALVPWLAAIGPTKAVRTDATTIWIAGRFDGNLAPCGCSSPMLGGIKRLATLVDRTPARSRLLLVNGGLLPPVAARTPAEFRQQTIKAESLAQSLAKLDVAAINLTLSEASRGPGVVEAVSRLSGKALISRSVDASVVSRETKKGRFEIVGVSAQPAALARALGAMSPPVSGLSANGRLLVMLDGSEADAEKLADSCPQAELIVYSSEGTPPPAARRNNAWLVSPGSGGRAAIRIQDDGHKLLAPEAISLGPELGDDPVIAKLYRGYLKRVADENLLGLWPRTKTAAFAGSETCAKCHANESRIWASSAHAHAWPDLVKVGHQADPDCVVCHVTGLSSTAGFRSLASTPKLVNVTCESCHGPAQAHALDPKAAHLPKLGLASCRTCHTPDNSPRFDPQIYWAKIAHGRSLSTARLGTTWGSSKS